MNIHKPEYKFECATNKLKQDPDVTEHNKKLILDFVDSFLAEGNSIIRAVKYIYTLKKASKLINKNLDTIIKKDATLFFKYINTTKDMMEWTKHDYKVMVKRFYQWLFEELKLDQDDNKLTKKQLELKEAIKYVLNQKVKRAKSREKTSEHMLKPDEVLKMADNTTNSRDRAFILTFYESMCRIGEIIPVHIGDLEDDDYGIKMNVTGKTGKRTIRLVVSAPAISNWLTNHLDRDNKKAFLFPGIGRNNQGDMLSYASARKLIFDAAKKAGIDKRVNLHKFRASRASELSKGLTESILCKIGGWKLGSAVLREYVYLGRDDADKEVLKFNGLVKEEDMGEGFKLIVCPRCMQKNTPKARFCQYCSMPLDQRAVMNYDRLKEKTAKQIDENQDNVEAIVEAVLRRLGHIQ
jgi:integrase